MNEDTKHYEFPTSCERCGSENVVARIIWDKGIFRVLCLDCNHSRSLPSMENLKRRFNPSLSNWAVQVKKRQPWCSICGSRDNLEAHHIIPVSHSRRFMYSMANGITLCKDCHRLVHNKEG